MVRGPSNTSAASAAPAPLGSGSYSFEVRQVDAVGNAGPWATEPFAILPAPATPSATVTKVAPKLKAKSKLKARVQAPRQQHQAPQASRRRQDQVEAPGPEVDAGSQGHAPLQRPDLHRRQEQRAQEGPHRVPPEARVPARPAGRAEEGLVLRLAGLALPEVDVHGQTARSQPLLHQEAIADPPKRGPPNLTERMARGAR